MKVLKKFLNFRQWNFTAKRNALLVLCIVIAIIILAEAKPARQKLTSQASDKVQHLIKMDQNRSRKHVTITYNDLLIINYCSFSSSGAEEINEKFIGFAGHIYKADKGVTKVTGQMVNYTYRMLGCGENMMHGAKLTILLTTLTVIFGVILGIFLALGKISKKKWLSKFCNGYIFFFRGTPLLIQLFVVYFSIPGIFGFAWRNFFGNDTTAVYKGAFAAALITFSLNSGAYCAEIVRAAIQSIDKGQYEASRALGMNYAQTMSKVIIPQSVRRMIPPVCNEFIMVLKDVSLVFAISLMDITTVSKNIMTSEGSYLVFVPALIIYLLITMIFTYIFDKIEKKFSIYE